VLVERLVVVVVDLVFPAPFFDLKKNQKYLDKIKYHYIRTVFWWFPVGTIAVYAIDSYSHFTALMICVKRHLWTTPAMYH
jgi:hypothetical protein